jgi:Tol biopolymer transport system component
MTKLVKIYKASLDNDKWVNITELPDSDNYSTAHPILSPDEKTLYFVSDMPGTIGLFLIYLKQTTTELLVPVNLGNRY